MTANGSPPAGLRAATDHTLSWHLPERPSRRARHTLSPQLGIADPDCVLAYRESEIRVRYGYREFTDIGIQFCLEPWLSA